MASKKILVVDDEAMITRLCRKALTKEGYEVRCASSGEEALGLADVALWHPPLARQCPVAAEDEDAAACVEREDLALAADGQRAGCGELRLLRRH